MSETDDTDDLLLIPPDFFLIDTDSDKTNSPYYTVVDSLITQVSNLEDRISFIENNSDVSVLSNSSFDITNNMHSPVPAFRKFRSQEDISQSPITMTSESTQSTPLKPRTKFRLSSLPTSPQINRFSPKKDVRSPQKHTTLQASRDVKFDRPRSVNTAGERDSFISNVKTIKRLNTVRSLENEFDHTTANTKKLEIDDIDKMLRDMEIQQKEIETRIVQKEREIFSKEPTVAKEKTWRCGDDFNTVPDLGLGIRNMYKNPEVYSKQTVDSSSFTSNFTDTRPYLPTVEPPISKDCHYSTNVSSLPRHDDSSAGNERSSSNSSTGSTQLTAFNRYSENDNLGAKYKSVSSNKPTENQTSFADHKYEESSHSNGGRRYPDSSNVTNNLSLVSLSHLWGSRTNKGNSSSYVQKLQEEKLRRQHCEEVIQQLQNRTLELQEKLAVAVQVDEAKDMAIHKFYNAWQDASNRIKLFSDESSRSGEEMKKLNEKHLRELDEANQRISHYENEVSKALSLAHTNHEKFDHLEQRCADLERELRSSETKLSELQTEYSAEQEKNKMLSDIVAKKELELEEGKAVLNGARKEVAESKRAVEVCQAEFSSMKSEYNNLETVLREKENRILELDKQKRKLVEEVEAHKSIAKSLQDELNKTRGQMDNNKVELKHFYQNQVEMVVQNKLKEFQTQLDQAESLLREELKKKELAIAKTAASHIQQISEKYSIEIKLLEEKHREEVKLYHIKLSQYQQQLEEMEIKFQHQQEKREQIADQLRKVMEAQWMEALRIISNSRSPIAPPEYAFDQLNSLKSRSYNNLEEVLSNMGDAPKNSRATRKRSGRDNMHTDSYYSLTEDVQDSIPHQAYKASEETPVTSRGQNRQHTESELQNYIQMLLNKQPGNPTGPSEDQVQQQLDSISSEAINWQFLSQSQLKQQGDVKPDQRGRRGKPPWK